MADPIEIKVVGEDDSGPALSSAEGNIRKLEATADDAGSGLKSASEQVERFGDAARGAAPDLQRLADGSREASSDLDRIGGAADNAGGRLDDASHKTDRLRRVLGEGGRGVEEFGTGLGGVGDRADEMDTRMMGLSDGIQGVTDLMGGNGKLRAHEYAMAFSDIGSSLYNFVIPQLRSLVETGSNVIDKLGGVKMAAGLAAGAAGLGALLVSIKAADDASNARNMDSMLEKLQASAYAANEHGKAMVWLAATTGHLDEMFGRVKESGNLQAEQFIDLAEKAGVDSDAIADMRAQLDTHKAAQEQATEASDEYSRSLETEADRIRGVADAHRAALDPVFAMVDAIKSNEEAQRSVTEAQAALDDAIKEHGRRSDEAAEAQRNLNDAQDAATKTAYDYESAAADLAAQISEHPATLSNAMLALRHWKDEGLITTEQARRMAIQFQNAANKADNIQGTRQATLRAYDGATPVIRPVQDRLRQLDGQRADVYVVGHASGAAIGGLLAGFAAGGPVGAASGGVHGGLRLVGEQGPELVRIPYGSMVNPTSNTRQMLGVDARGQGVTLVYQGDGSSLDRALFEHFRSRIRDEHGGDVQAALGYARR